MSCIARPCPLCERGWTGLSLGRQQANDLLDGDHLNYEAHGLDAQNLVDAAGQHGGPGLAASGPLFSVQSGVAP